jgi:hypothetical protein
MPATPYEIYQIVELWSAHQSKYVRLRRLFRYNELARKVQENVDHDDRELFWYDSPALVHVHCAELTHLAWW